MNSLYKLEKVDRLYRINLDKSIKHLTDLQIKSSVIGLVGDGSIYKLINSYIDIQVFDDKGIDCSADIRNFEGCLVPLGEITRIMYDIALRDAFDLQVREIFPCLKFVRYTYEVFISTTNCNSRKKLIEEDLLNRLNLIGCITEIKPYELYFISNGLLLFLESKNGLIFICDYSLSKLGSLNNIKQFSNDHQSYIKKDQG